MSYLLKVKKTGTKIICVDPRQSQTCRSLAKEWIPIKPGTDAAMLITMAYVIINERLCCMDFIKKYTYGFKKFKEYVTGKEDGIEKSSQWAQNPIFRYFQSLL